MSRTASGRLPNPSSHRGVANGTPIVGATSKAITIRRAVAGTMATPGSNRSVVRSFVLLSSRWSLVSFGRREAGHRHLRLLEPLIERLCSAWTRGGGRQ